MNMFLEEYLHKNMPEMSYCETIKKIKIKNNNNKKIQSITLIL